MSKITLHIVSDGKINDNMVHHHCTPPATEVTPRILLLQRRISFHFLFFVFNLCSQAGEPDFFFSLLTPLAPHSHMWGQGTLIISSLPPNRDCGTKGVKGGNPNRSSGIAIANTSGTRARQLPEIQAGAVAIVIFTYCKYCCTFFCSTTLGISISAALYSCCCIHGPYISLQRDNFFLHPFGRKCKVCLVLILVYKRSLYFRPG